LPQEAGATLILGEEPPQVGADASARIPLELAIDWSQCAEGDARAEAYQTEIQAELMFAFAETEQTTVGFCAEAVSPRIRAPTFTVTAIVVNQGELINTRLKVALKIDNPNAFPLQLSGLAYAFYGDQRFWADGNDRAVRHIPPQSSTEAQISMVMNFIDMNRKLLEDILTAKQIDYRLTGEAAVLTTNEYLPRFSVDFDLSGNSVVMK
jgi:LEA14-like dessication related protein